MFAEITLAIDPKKRFVNFELQNFYAAMFRKQITLVLCIGQFIFLAENLR